MRTSWALSRLVSALGARDQREPLVSDDVQLTAAVGTLEFLAAPVHTPRALYGANVVATIGRVPAVVVDVRSAGGALVTLDAGQPATISYQVDIFTTAPAAMTNEAPLTARNFAAAGAGPVVSTVREGEIAVPAADDTPTYNEQRIRRTYYVPSGSSIRIVGYSANLTCNFAVEVFEYVEPPRAR